MIMFNAANEFIKLSLNSLLFDMLFKRDIAMRKVILVYWVLDLLYFKPTNAN